MENTEQRQQSRWWRHIRNVFLTGILAGVPMVVTYLVFRWLFLSLDAFFQPVIILLLGRPLPGVGVAAALILIYLLGLITTNLIGRRLVGSINNMLCRAPVIGYIYGPATQVVNALRSLRQVPFKKVVIIEFPKTGIHSLAFLTGKPVDFKGQKRFPLFVPNVPNPMSGFLVLVPPEDIIDTDMTVDEAMRMVLSGGLLTPEAIP